MKGIDIERQSDGKVFAKQIRRCVCGEKKGDLYIINCRIKGLGEHIYECQANRDFIQKPHLKNNGKKVWLSDNAKLSINKAIDDFDKTVAQAKNGSYTEAIIIPGKFTLYYKHLEDYLYHFILEYISRENRTETILFTDCGLWGRQGASPIGEMLLQVYGYLRWHCLHTFDESNNRKDEAVLEILENGTEQNIKDNPVFKAAVTSDDIITQTLLKQHYNIDSLEETKWLAENVFHMDLLPRLPEKYNKDYYVKSSTITNDYRFFYCSGYKVILPEWKYIPRPDNITSSISILNPCTRKYIDEGPKEAESEAISFDEYLELFKDYR